MNEEVVPAVDRGFEWMPEPCEFAFRGVGGPVTSTERIMWLASISRVRGEFTTAKPPGVVAFLPSQYSQQWLGSRMDPRAQMCDITMFGIEA